MRVKWMPALFITALLLSGCAAKDPEPYTLELYAMSTRMTLRLYGGAAEEAASEAERLIFDLEKKISMHLESSEVSRLNANSAFPFAVSDELFDLLTLSLEISQKTNGAFDVTAAPLVELWGIGTRRAQVPARADIEKALLSVGYESLLLGPGGVTFLKEGMAVDLGAVGKGYAADRVLALLGERGVESAVVSLGGNVYVKGTKPGGGPFIVGVTDPENPGGMLGKLPLTDVSVVTSGAYERYFEQDGKIYHHIFDTKTGYPADSGLLSATVIAKSSAVADAYSTAFFVMGKDASLEHLSKTPGVSAIFVTEDHEIYLTHDLKDQFELMNQKYTIK